MVHVIYAAEMRTMIEALDRAYEDVENAWRAVPLSVKETIPTFTNDIGAAQGSIKSVRRRLLEASIGSVEVKPDIKLEKPS